MKTDKKYCFYYSGEAENPFNPEDARARWWWYESRYFGHSFMRSDHKQWEDMVKNCIHDIPAVEPIMNCPDVSIETKGFLVWSIGTTMGHDPYEDFTFFREYGRGFLPEYIWDGSSEPIDWTLETKLNFCLYYKGEDVCPFDPQDDRSVYWDMEKSWVKLVAGDEDRGSKYVMSFCLDFGGGLDGFKIEPTLKATMYDQYTHFGGSKSGFVDFLLDYLARAKR